MNRCLAFSRIAWTCTKYSQSLRCLQTRHYCFYNLHVRNMCAVTECSSRTVSSICHSDSVAASQNHVRHMQRYCSNKAENKMETTKESSPGLFRRFHQTYKKHGKILVCVHLVTSTVWAGAFYCAAARGVDVVPLLQWLGAGDRVIAPFTKPGVGHAAVAYLLYKLATPLRYTVTIGGTHLSVKYLRRWGYLPPIASSDTIRSMVKTKFGEVRDRRSHRRRSRRRKH